MKLVIFDFDGTLADTETLITQAMMKTLAELHLEPSTSEQCRRLIGLPLAETFTRLQPMTQEMGERCAEVYQRIFARDNRPGVVRLFPQVRPTLQALYDAGLTLTVATSRQRPSLMGFLRDMQIDHLFSYIVTVNDVAHAKPSPDMVLSTLAHTGINAADALMVGDAVYDIQMGIAAGVHTCAVTYGNGSRQALEACGAEHLIDCFSQLAQIAL